MNPCSVPPHLRATRVGLLPGRTSFTPPPDHDGVDCVTTRTVQPLALVHLGDIQLTTFLQQPTPTSMALSPIRFNGEPLSLLSGDLSSVLDSQRLSNNVMPSAHILVPIQSIGPSLSQWVH